MTSSAASTPNATTIRRDNDIEDGESRFEELSSTDAEEYEEELHQDNKNLSTQYSIPWYYRSMPFLADELETETSETQDAVAEMCRELMSGEAQEIVELNSHGIPKLLKDKHIKFLHHILGKYPSGFQVMDASRPWILYWGLAGLSHLGQDVTKYRERTIQTFAPMQNADGGFGGGHGQTSHCAGSYAAVLSLAMVDGLDSIDRKTMWHWIGSVKQKDGGFRMAIGGEEDVRGAYCAMTIINLLNLPLHLPPKSPARITGDETFLTGLGAWLGRCQTFEGGMGGAPDNEAHGAYAFCTLACLSIMDAPYRSIPQYINVDRLVSWLSARQIAPEGGFSGRTNKLVDACYSHWVGGCWPLIEAALTKSGGVATDDKSASISSLWSREALVRYTLCCSQVKAGGLRDKPGTRADGYHTCYSLAGLSTAQNHWTYDESRRTKGADHEAARNVSGLVSAFHWVPRKAREEERAAWAFDEEDTVDFVHPVFVIPPEAVDRAQRKFRSTVGF